MDKVKFLYLWCRAKITAFWAWYKNLYVGAPVWKKALIGFVSVIVSFLLYLGAVDINFLWLFGKSPGYFSGILNPQTSQASEIYSADGQLIGKFFSENRTPVKYEEITPDFFKALVDTEDERFYSHFGIDPIGIFGAVKDAALRHEGRGASTITQQLAKNMFRVRSHYSTGLLGKIPGLRILIVKSKEWIIALKLESRYSKKDIITMYANTVDFGSNAFGIKTAAKTYFNKLPKDLTTDEAAILVGMLKATTYYNPKSHPENSRSRRNVVLSNMLKHGDLSRSRYGELSKLDIKLNYKVEDNYDGQATYFRNAVAEACDSLLVGVSAGVGSDDDDNKAPDLYTSGLKIYTTIDTRMQKYAEEAANKQMRIIQRNFNNHWGKEEPWQDEHHQVIPGFIEGIAKRQPFYKALVEKFGENADSIDYYLNKPHKVKVFDYANGEIEMEMSSLDSIRYMVRFMHCGMVAMEPQTGAVKAWVGDIDFKHWKYDKVTAMRQPGSTFKLFVYTEAMNQGLTPCDKRRDEQISLDVYDSKKQEMTRWTPTNANGTFSGDSMPLKSAFARSVNSIAVRLGQEMGIKRIISTAHAMGIDSPLDDAPALALGSSDVRLLELVNSYCTVADNGRRHKPMLVTRVEDRDGRVIYQADTQSEQAISTKSAFFMQQLLQGGMREPGGTSQSLWGYVGDVRDTEFGGKTGTSNNHSDAWFVGVSPRLVVGAWVGGEYRCIHFRTGALGQGSRTALPICGYFLQSVFKDPAFQQYHGKFVKPADADISRVDYICDSYYQKAKNDSTATDSLELNSEEIILDENGNPVIRKEEKSEVGTSSEPGSQGDHKPHKPTEQAVRFDDL